MSCCPKPARKTGVRDLAHTLARSFAHAYKTGEVVADGETIGKRIDICMKCSRFTGQRCLECGCFIHLKAALPAASCPVGKW